MGKCYACEWQTATRQVKGQGPMCDECFGNLIAIVALTRSKRERPKVCGCTSVHIGCNFARNLRTRAKMAERRARDIPEIDQEGRRRLATASTNMMLALRAHLIA